MSDSVVIIPTYNEKENIRAITEAVLALEPLFDILVIDDGSPDGTADIVRVLQKEHPGRIQMIERSGKLGLGTAYLTGFKKALESGYEYIFEMDADFSHNPADLPALRKACAADGADVAVGSRYVTGVNVAYGQGAYVVLCVGIRAFCHRAACARHYCGICVLYPPCA